MRKKTTTKTPQKYEIDPYYDTPEWRDLRMRVCQRDKHLCQYCGDRGFQADHIVPRKRGGPDTMKNLVCCCHTCNKTALNSTFVSFSAKKRWLLVARGIVEKPPVKPFVRHQKTYLERKPPKRGLLRQKLAEKNNPDHFQMESLLKSQS